MDHEPELTDIIDLLEGRLDPVRTRQVAAQLAEAEAQGAPAADTVAFLRRFTEAAASVAFSPPPPELVARLHALMPARPSLVERLVDRAGELVARLVQDLDAGPMLAGARGPGATASARQLVFEADDGTEVSLRLAAGPDRSITVDGQVFSDDPARELVLSSGDGHTATTADEAGEFAFPAVAVAPGAQLQLVVGSGPSPIRVDLTPFIPQANQEPRR